MVVSTSPGGAAEAAAGAEAQMCPKCRQVIDTTQRAWRLRLCPACGYHLTMGAAERIGSLADPGIRLARNELRQPVGACDLHLISDPSDPSPALHTS